MRESTAEDAALLSAWFASRRNRVLLALSSWFNGLCKYAYLHEVVRIVNQVYAAKVTAVMAAKSQPNLYVWDIFSNGKCGYLETN